MGMENRVVVVTGGAGGIGRACAEAVLADGGIPVVLDRAPAGPEPDPIPRHRVDVTDEPALAAVLDRVAERHGRIDVVVNNAAVVRAGAVEEGAVEDWTRLWEVNVLGYARVVRCALPHLRRSPAGAIVNMSSFTAAAGVRGRVAYSATKGAIEAMTRALAADLVADGITVNAVRPGTVDTALLASLADRAPDPSAARAVYAARQPTGRMVTVDEVARAVLFLADPACRSTTGSVVAVDGGISDIRSLAMD